MAVALALALALALGACGHGDAPAKTASTTTAAAGSTETCALPAGTKGPASTFAADSATALAFAPDGRLFVAERSGTIEIATAGGVSPFATVDTVTTESGGGYSERGLLGLALSPSFADDHFVFAFFSNRDRSHQSVVRWKECAGKATEEQVVVQLPAGDDCCHKGGRLAFGPDGKLYVSLGDEHSAAAAQDTGDPRGKILRYDADGTVPADNPFGAGNPVWVYGLRNPFGLAVAADGSLGLTINGPSGEAGSPGTGYDLAVVGVARGQGLQWPHCYGYDHPIGGADCGAGLRTPDWSSETTTVVPTGAAFLDDRAPAPLAGHFVFCTYSRGMRILTPGSPHASVAEGPSGCKLDVKQAPDGTVWFSDDGHVTRFTG